MIFFNPFPNKPWFLCVCSTSLLKTLWEIARNEQFLLFPQCFLPFSRTSYHFHWIRNCHLQTLLVWKNLKLVVWERIKMIFYHTPLIHIRGSKWLGMIVVLVPVTECKNKLNYLETDLQVYISDIWYKVNFFLNNPLCFGVCSKSLLKTQWEKEKLLLTSNSSFSHSVFYLFGELSSIFIKFRIVVCRLFQFVSV